MSARSSESHNVYVREEVDNVLSFGGIVGRSRALRPASPT
jgi:hypothetical protein